MIMKKKREKDMKFFGRGGHNNGDKNGGLLGFLPRSLATAFTRVNHKNTSKSQINIPIEEGQNLGENDYIDFEQEEKPIDYESINLQSLDTQHHTGGKTDLKQSDTLKTLDFAKQNQHS